MATGDITVGVGTNKQIRFCVSGSFLPVDPATDHTIGTPTNVLLTLSALTNAAARQSNKADLTSAWARVWTCFGAFDFTGETPVAGQYVDVYWFPSTSATAANGNIAGNSGVDGAAPDGALGGITLAEFLALGTHIGRFPVHDGAVVQNGYIGDFVPPTEWGQIVVVNEADDAFEADNVEMAIWIQPKLENVSP